MIAALLNIIATLINVAGQIRRTIMRHVLRACAAVAIVLATALPGRAECYADYKAKQDNPLRLAYGVSLISDAVCDKPRLARAELAPRLDAAGWTLLKILSTFGPEGLEERKASAGDFFLRY
jgi:hypothetical protein